MSNGSARTVRGGAQWRNGASLSKAVLRVVPPWRGTSLGAYVRVVTVHVRVCVLNVHCWFDLNGEPRVDQCIDALKDIHADVCLLNEVPALDDTLRAVAT